jgi:dolichol-phosphate mannosyltransferase
MDIQPVLSIVVPLFNEEPNLIPLYEKLTKITNTISNNYEIIFVDDGSTDTSFSIIKKISSDDKHVKGISLSRNFGHQAALTAGLESAKGKTVAMMDADLQHPPELIKEMYKLYLQGFDVVNTRRMETKVNGYFKSISSRWFYKFLNTLSDFPIEPSSADFRLVSAKALEAFLQMRERNRFTRGMVNWVGFKQTYLSYTASERNAGSSKYTLKKMLSLGLNGITAFSSKPLRMAFYAGLLIFLFGIIYAIYAIVEYFSGKTIPGWTSILLSVLIIGGFQLLSLGIIGEYIARIFNEVKARPLYLIKETT